MTIEHYSAEDWEQLRGRFNDSILNDTELSVLGQNASISWPFKGSDETPAKYVQFDFEELQSVPGLIGKKSRIKKLMDILRETLAFDDPFGDMADTVEEGTIVDDAFERILEKLDIPAAYPAQFIHFAPETKELLKQERVETLLETIHFGQKLPNNAVAGSDLKSFLNGLALLDEPSIIKHLPYRRTERDLHLAEAVGLIARDLDEPIQLALLGQAGETLSAEEEALSERVSQTAVDTALKEAMASFDGLCTWFTKEAEDLEHACKTGGGAERYFIAINEPRRERVASVLARAKFGIPASERRGFLGKLSGMFGS